MYTCFDKAAVDSIYENKTPRDPVVVMREIYPDATFDGTRYHAPYDGFYCDMTDRTYRAGEYLPTHADAMIVRASVRAMYHGNVIVWQGSLAQIAAVKTELKRQNVENAKSKSNHIGQIGDKITTSVTINLILTFDGIYGKVYSHIMADNSGNVIVYKGNKILGKKGQTINIAAKIKSHSEYQEVKQTIVERPKVI